MGSLFSGCNELKSLDLSNFDTSLVTNMNNMFYGCSLLESLDISKFDTSLVTDMTSMFEQCSKLGYINMNDFSELDNLNTLNMFLGTPDDIIYCIGNENLTPSIKSQLHEKDCKNLDCEMNWQQNYNNMIEEKKKRY